MSRDITKLQLINKKENDLLSPEIKNKIKDKMTKIIDLIKHGSPPEINEMTIKNYTFRRISIDKKIEDYDVFVTKIHDNLYDSIQLLYEPNTFSIPRLGYEKPSYSALFRYGNSYNRSQITYFLREILNDVTSIHDAINNNNVDIKSSIDSVFHRLARLVSYYVIIRNKYYKGSNRLNVNFSERYLPIKSNRRGSNMSNNSMSAGSRQVSKVQKVSKVSKAVKAVKVPKVAKAVKVPKVAKAVKVPKAVKAVKAPKASKSRKAV